MAFQEYYNAPSDSSKKMRVSTRLKNHHRILSDDDKQILSEYDDIDFVVIYEGILGARQETGADDKGGFCGPKPQVPFLADGACPVCS